MQRKLFKNNYRNLIIIILSLILISACTSSENMASSTQTNGDLTINTTKQKKTDLSPKVNQAENKEIKNESKEIKSKNENKDVYHEISFLAVGDVMVHKAQLKRAYIPATDSFNFIPSFVYAQPFIASANFSLANLETTLAGRSKYKKLVNKSMYYGYSGYPNFNAPNSLADALKWAGFNFIGTANNHSLDKRLPGVVNTIAYLDKIGVDHTGTFNSLEERNKLKVVQVGELKVGIIAYTYATNGISLKPEEMYRINTLNYYQDDKINELYETVKKAKKEPIDLLFVMMHYGNEYWEKPEMKHQAEITKELKKLGVDMIIGSHPHTLQPLICSENNEIILNKSSQPPTSVTTHKDKNSKQINVGEKTREWSIDGIFSLGNFISSQRVISDYKTDTDTGAMIKWVYQWKNDEKPTLVKVGIMPTIVVWQNDRATILPINDVSIAAAKADPTVLITPYVESRIANAKNTVIKRLTAYMPESIASEMKLGPDYFNYIYLRPEIKQKK